MDSRNPIETKKRLSTMYVMAAPGGMIVHQGAYPLCMVNVKASILPHVTILASPIPKKLIVASNTSADATAMVMYKNVKWITFGKMCLKIILLEVAPETCAASIKDLVFRLLTCALIARALVGHNVKDTPRMMAICAWYAPQEWTIKATRGMEGHTKKVILIRCKILSTYPP